MKRTGSRETKTCAPRAVAPSRVLALRPMKLHTFVGAPNPKRVHIYLAEKGIELERVDVSILAGETRTESFRNKNPMGGLPVLELDDGSYVSESLAIIEYFEELQPQPPMIGQTALERLHVRELERICEIGVLLRLAQVLQQSHPFFASRYQQNAEVAEGGLKLLHGTLKVLDAKIGDRPFLAGDRVTIADCTLFASLWFAHAMGVAIDLSARPNLTRWNEAFRKRPSAKA
jgi:glutathione S-transferase